MLLNMVESGSLDWLQTITACVNYMTDDEVKEMMELNDFFTDDEDAENAA
jgi:hypothetical protein